MELLRYRGTTVVRGAVSLKRVRPPCGGKVNERQNDCAGMKSTRQNDCERQNDCAGMKSARQNDCTNNKRLQTGGPLGTTTMQAKQPNRLHNPDTLPICDKCGKVRYSSEKAARRALHQQQRYNARVKRIYYERDCGFWHLASSTTFGAYEPWTSSDADGTPVQPRKHRTRKNSRAQSLNYIQKYYQEFYKGRV